MDEYVMVPVPKGRVLEVYEFLATSPTPSVAERRTPWPPEMLKRCYRESQPPFQKVLDTLADHPGQAVSGRDLDMAVGATRRNVLAGVMSAAARRVSGRYHLRFPWESEWRPAEGIKYYTMSAEDAAVIRSLREAV